ncbi:hypothetical protein TSUD_99960 [Trifolium subterraneum]|uniref:Reverse transcriptase/retrotransposon-derived protein RNase H-like domain-containing protein n=1 Tax=Trifolium subterraneum TaxID=3900 RepID=A0A2Z6NLM2_TRISU|nr:hypothetical protein TSUD_99960 [Trifolium subterraneum]
MARTNAERIDELTEKVDTIITQLQTLTTQSRPTPTPTPPPYPPPQPPHFLPRMKLDVPKFDGTDAMGWIFKISQFFDFHQTTEEERLTVASFYMEGPALSWYQWMHKNNQINTWFGFLQALEMRFAPSYYDEPSSALFKLVQKTTVNSYLIKFERLTNRIVGLPQPFLLSCFISGLSPEIRREVQALRPLSLTQATALAKLQEDKIEDRRRLFKTKTSASTTTTNALPSSSNLPALLPNPKPPNRVNFRKLSPEEMANRREKGLCYNCDETFTPQHKCKGRFFLLIADDDFDSDEPPIPPPTIESPPPESPPIITDPSEAQISFHAMSGSTDQTTIRIPGRLANHPVTVLIDGGSTHNFVQTRLAKFLNLPSLPTNTLKVMVGNGSILTCQSLCAATPLSLQQKTFSVDLYTLPLCGADVVLGVPWLRSIGPVLMDYTSLSLSYTQNNKTITLAGKPPSKPNNISAQQLKRCFQTNSASELFHIQAISIKPNPTSLTPITHPNSQIQTLLLRFPSLFNEPSQLPPPRSLDHRINLLPNSKPVNLKRKMEAGDFVWTTEPLTPLLLEIDFPLPTIDELLDELGRAYWFSKLDLQQAFLGLTGFYRKFIKSYASIALPLTSLLIKDAFHWNDQASQAFLNLKTAMTNAPTLSLPDFTKPFVIETDASGLAMGAVLMQNSHPIAFFSKPFCPRLRRSSTNIRELHAITTAVKKWRQYLLGHPFIIYTDHQSLKELLTQAVQTPEQQIYLAKLMGYEYSIHYKTGKSNVVADALSRLPETPSRHPLLRIRTRPKAQGPDPLDRWTAHVSPAFCNAHHGSSAVFRQPLMGINCPSTTLAKRWGYIYIYRAPHTCQRYTTPLRVYLDCSESRTTVHHRLVDSDQENNHPNPPNHQNQSDSVETSVTPEGSAAHAQATPLDVPPPHQPPQLEAAPNTATGRPTGGPTSTTRSTNGSGDGCIGQHHQQAGADTSRASG